VLYFGQEVAVDFADIGEYPPADFPGIWVLRSRSQAAENVLSLLRGAIAVLDSESPANRLWIIEPRLSKAFGTTPESWLNQQMHYDLWLTQKSIGKLEVDRLSAA
jgi:hypothetical protein